MKFGILFRWGSWWIGGHWSDHNKRLCVNPVPMITVWITAQGGKRQTVGMGLIFTATISEIKNGQ